MHNQPLRPTWRRSSCNPCCAVNDSLNHGRNVKVLDFRVRIVARHLVCIDGRDFRQRGHAPALRYWAELGVLEISWEKREKFGPQVSRLASGGFGNYRIEIHKPGTEQPRGQLLPRPVP